MPLTVDSRALVQYKFATHLAIDTFPTASTPAMQGKTISLTFKPVSEPISDSFIKTLRNLVKDLPASVPEASEIDRTKTKAQRAPCRVEDALNGCLCGEIVDTLIVHPTGYSSANKLAVRLSG